MSVTSFVARRYLQAGRNNRFFSWISVLTIAGVAIGVATMIVVWSVINGFEFELRKRFLAANAHIMAYRFPHGVPNYQEWVDRLNKDFADDMRGVSPFIHYETLASNRSLMHTVMVRGIDPEARKSVQSLDIITRPPEALDILQEEIERSKAGAPLPDNPAIIVGTGLLSLLDAEVGDTVNLVEPEKQDLGEMKAFKIIGVYDSGLKHYDNKIGIMSLSTAQVFFGMGARVTGLEIGLRKPWGSKEVAKEMLDRYSLSIREWQSYNRPFFKAMEMERVVILLIVFMVALVAGFNILTTIFVGVSQKQRDISILKALGADNKQIMTLFVKQGVYIGLVGCVIGCVLAVGICQVLERYQFIDLPDIYLLARLPITYEWWVYVAVAALSLVIAVAAAIVPAALASRVNPVDGFRGNQGMA